MFVDIMKIFYFKVLYWIIICKVVWWNKMVIVKNLKGREYKNGVGISKDLWLLIV